MSFLKKSTRIRILDTTAASSTSTGAFVVDGGMGISGNSIVGGTVNISNTSAATSTTTGALTVGGGIGVLGSIYAGGDLVIEGASVVNGFDFVLGRGDQVTRGDSGSSRAMVKDSSATLVVNFAGDFTGGVRIDSVLNVNNTSTASSLSTGAFKVAGDIAVSKSIHVGQGIINRKGLTTVNTDANHTYTNTEVVPGAKIFRTSTTNTRTDTLPAAANLVAALSGPTVGLSYKFVIMNGTSNQLFIDPGTGNNVGTAVLDVGQTASYHIIFTNVSSGTEQTYASFYIS